MVRKILVMAALAVAASAGHAAEPLRDLPISVQVLDATGQPVSGGRVRFAGGWVGETVKDGWAHDVRDTIRPGVVQVSYVKEGVFAARRVRVRETDQAMVAAIRLGQEPVAEGQALGSDGTPLPDAKIHVQATAGLIPLGGSCKLDREGRFRVDGFCLDGAIVTAKAPGFVRSNRQRIIEPFPTSIRFTVLREATISLTITDASGRPIPDARCAASTVTAGPRRTVSGRLITRPDSKEKAEIRFVRPGKVRVVAYAPAYEIQLQEVHVPEGGQVSDLRFHLKPVPMVTLRGLVVGPDGGTPVPEAHISIGDHIERARSIRLMLTGQSLGGNGYGSEASYGGSADENGRFEFRAPLGTYRVARVNAAGYAGHMAFQFEVTSSVSPLRFQLFRGGRVEGTVRTPDGSLPPEGTRARLHLPIGQFGGTGREAAVSPETGRFVFEHVRPGPAQLTIDFPDHAAAKAEFEVVEGEVVEPVLRFPPEARIIGKVVDGRDGSPIPMAGVSAVLESHHERRTAVTEDDGTFEFLPMTAGKAWLSVWLPRYAPVRQRIDTSGGGLYEVTLKTSPGGRIDGKLADALLASAERPTWVGLRAGLESVAGTEPDAAGYFVLTHIAPGSYALVAGSSPRAMWAGKGQEVTVREGETTRVVLQAP